MRHFLSLLDISQQELQTILSIAEQVKAILGQGRRPAWLPRQILALLFEKQSLRTRVSFEAGFAHFGGTAMFLGQDVGWQKREATSDFVQVLAQYADYLVCRAKSHKSVEELASFDCVPVINGLTDKSHPCQALADLLTVRRTFGALAGLQVTFIGDGNNVAYSLALASAMVGMRFRLLGPKDYFLPDDALQEIHARFPNADIEQSAEPDRAVRSADVIYTDVWTSMGQEAEEQERIAAFTPYQVNNELVGKANRNCKILHCLPAKRGEEITAEVIDSADSLIIEQAGNRMHAQKGLLLWLALQHGKLAAKELEAEGVELPIGTS